jgi:hypothetical protein
MAMNYSDGISVNYRVITLLNQSWVAGGMQAEMQP